MTNTRISKESRCHTFWEGWRGEGLHIYTLPNETCQSTSSVSERFFCVFLTAAYKTFLKFCKDVFLIFSKRQYLLISPTIQMTSAWYCFHARAVSSARTARPNSNGSESDFDLTPCVYLMSYTYISVVSRKPLCQ